MERRIASGKPDYWGFATLLELAVIANQSVFAPVRAPPAVNLSSEQLHIASIIDARVEAIARAGVDDIAIFAEMADGMAVFPNLTAEQREKGLTDFNDLALENQALAEHQLENAVWRARQRSEEVIIGGRDGTKSQEIYLPKDPLERVAERSMEATIGERV